MSINRSADGNEIINAKSEGDAGYIVSWRGKRGEVYAPTLYQAELRAAAHWKVKKSYEISTALCELSDGSAYVHSTAGL